MARVDDLADRRMRERDREYLTQMLDVWCVIKARIDEENAAFEAYTKALQEAHAARKRDYEATAGRWSPVMLQLERQQKNVECRLAGKPTPFPDVARAGTTEILRAAREVASLLHGRHAARRAPGGAAEEEAARATAAAEAAGLPTEGHPGEIVDEPGDATTEAAESAAG